jgi:hypothetical protein
MMYGSLVAALAVAANASSFSSELESKHDRLLTALIQGEETVDTRAMAKERTMPLAEAWSHIKKDEHLAFVQHEMTENDGLKITETTVNMARTRLNDMIHDAYTQLDIVVVRCKGDYDVNRKSFSIADSDYTYATAHKKKAEGMIVSSQGKVTGYGGVVIKTQGEIAAATGVFTDKKKALDDVIKDGIEGAGRHDHLERDRILGQEKPFEGADEGYLPEAPPPQEIAVGRQGEHPRLRLHQQGR